MAAMASLTAMGAPALPPLHPVRPGCLSRRGGLLRFGLQRLQRRREREAQRRPESEQGKRLSPRDHFRFEFLVHLLSPCR